MAIAFAVFSAFTTGAKKNSFTTQYTVWAATPNTVASNPVVFSTLKSNKTELETPQQAFIGSGLAYADIEAYQSSELISCDTRADRKSVV